MVRLCLCLSLLSLLSSHSHAATEEGNGGPKPLLVTFDSAEVEITPKIIESAKKGCDWLVKNQTRDGNLKSTYPCAATALAGLAWLANGSTPDHGPYAENIRSALRYILKNSGDNGFISENASLGPSGMYGHGYATQFLAQCQGMVRDAELAAEITEKLRKAVQSIEGTQNRYGGWNSLPNADLNDDGSGAIAVMQITALRAAESAGVPVRQAVIEKAKKYLLAMTSEDGWYAYNWHARGASNYGSIATTGAGMYMLGVLNLHSEAKYRKGIANLMDHVPGKTDSSAFGGWYAYAAFYASLAIFQHGGKNWKEWYPAMAAQLMQTQHGDGSWSDSYGGVFVALSVLSLELPFRYLPLFQEGGAGREGE